MAFDAGTLATAGIAAFTTIVGGVITFFAGRRQANASAQVTIAKGFEILVENLQKERVELARVIEKQSEHIEEQAAQIGRLRDEVASLKSDLGDAILAWRRGDPAPVRVPTGNR